MRSYQGAGAIAASLGVNMKRSGKVLLWIAGVIVGLIVLLVIVVATFDWNRLKPFIGDKVSQAIGRPFAINGNLSATWQRDASQGGLRSLVPLPEFTAREVSIGNPAWARSRQFATLAALRFELSPLPLLAHRIDVPLLRLVQPRIDMERDKSSRATWTFTPAQSNGQPSAWQLNLGTIGFDRGEVTFDDAITATKATITIEPLQQAIPYDQLVAQQSSSAREAAGKRFGAAAGKTLGAATSAGTNASAAKIGQATPATTYLFGWNVEGSYQGAPLKGQGKTGGTLALRDASEPFPLQADVRIGDSHIALVGTLTDPLHLGALDLRLWLSGTSMAGLFPLTGVTLPDTPPYATEGHLQATLDGAHGGHYRYRDFRARVGGSDLAGDVAFDKTAARPKLSGTISSKMLRFSDLAPLIGADSNQQKQQRGDSTPQPTDKVLPVEPFRTDRWRAMDADVKFSGAHIVRDKALPIDALSTHLLMDNGVLRLDPLRFGLAGGTVQSTIRLDGSKTPMQGALKLNARHLKLKQLFPTFAPMRTSFGEINGDVALSAHGNSVAALLGSSDGELKLLMNDGAISRTLLETAGLNVGNIVLGKLFGDRTVPINCAATDMVAQNGLFDMRLFVFDTGDAVINTDGTVNLATEQLQLEVKPHTKGLRIFSLRSPLYVEGTLKNPKVGVEKGPLLLRGAGAVALGAVAAPAALLALIAPSHDSEGDNTCRVVLDQLRHFGSMPNAAGAKAAGAKAEAAKKH
jgi:uncharacterized protein involved in outer membrane biogenesis